MTSRSSSVSSHRSAPTRSSSNSSRTADSPSQSPIRSKSEMEKGNATPRDVEEELPTDAELVLLCLQKNDLGAFQRVVGYIPETSDGMQNPLPEDEANIESVLSFSLYPSDGIMSGKNAVFFAAYLNRKDFLAYLSKFKCFERLVRPVILEMLSFQRYAMVFFVAGTLAPNLLGDSYGPSGDTLLHIACQRGKTPVAFIEELLANVKQHNPPLAAFVNIQNTSGDTPLHILGCRSKGKEGGNVAKMLLLAGAREDVDNIKGQTPRAVATNPYVRDLMGLGKGPRPRPIPQVDERSKSEIDKFKDSSLFPEIKSIDVPPVDPQLTLAASPFISEEARENINPKRKKSKKLSQEEADALAFRLSDQSVQLKKKWMDSKLSIIEDSYIARNKKLSEEECQAATRRLHDDELDGRGERKAAIAEKYMKPIPTGPQLGLDEIQESATRLGGKASVEAAKKKKLELLEKHSPSRERKRLNKEQQSASASRLHDESENHWKETHEKLHSKYCNPEPTRFSGKGKLRKKDQEAMADRLSTKK